MGTRRERVNRGVRCKRCVKYLRNRIEWHTYLVRKLERDFYEDNYFMYCNNSNFCYCPPITSSCDEVPIIKEEKIIDDNYDPHDGLKELSGYCEVGDKGNIFYYQPPDQLKRDLNIISCGKSNINNLLINIIVFTGMFLIMSAILNYFYAV